MVDDVVALLDKLKIDKAAIVGWIDGASSASTWRCLMPIG
jgi:pimeloyl-ACP methyl ester carboxylesterase